MNFFVFFALISISAAVNLCPQLPEDDEYDTIGGYLMTMLGRVPEVGEILKTNKAIFTTISATSTRVERIKSYDHRLKNVVGIFQRIALNRVNMVDQRLYSNSCTVKHINISKINHRIAVPIACVVAT